MEGEEGGYPQHQGPKGFAPDGEIVMGKPASLLPKNPLYIRGTGPYPALKALPGGAQRN
jgi:hypothetical protein